MEWGERRRRRHFIIPPHSGLGIFGHGTTVIPKCDRQIDRRRLVLIAPGDYGGCGQVVSVVDRRRSLLITLGVQLCV